MSIFIKPGFWDEKPKAPKHWLNLTQLITSIVNSLLPTPSYKVYSALITQTGTNDPTVVVLQNTLGEDINWQYSNVGDYVFTPFTILFPLDKTFITIGNNFINGTTVTPNTVLVVSESFLEIISVNELLVQSNDMLNNTPIEIRIYN